MNYVDFSNESILIERVTYVDVWKRLEVLVLLYKIYNFSWNILFLCFTDIVEPLLTCPSNYSIPTAADETMATFILPQVTATDNTMMVNITSNPGNNTVFALGPTLVIVMATDMAGNEATCNFTVTVVGKSMFQCFTSDVTGCSSLTCWVNLPDCIGSFWDLAPQSVEQYVMNGLGSHMSGTLNPPTFCTFLYKLMHHLKPFAIVVLNGEITVYSGFEW